MLTYDARVAVDGQALHSPTSIPTARRSIPSSPTTARPAAPLKANAVRPSAGSLATGGGLARGGARHVWLVTGPAGCGKTTVAKHLAASLHVPYVEGDEFHPKSNVEKMASGIPLTDADRWDWLTNLRDEAMHQLAAGNHGVVVTCSALKRKYRDVLRVAPYFDPDLRLHFIYLHAPEEVLLQRVTARQGHYMRADMVHSQLDILQPPTPEETDVVSIDVSGTPDQVMSDALAMVRRTMADGQQQQQQQQQQPGSPGAAEATLRAMAPVRASQS